MAEYVLLPMRKWEGLEEWEPFLLGERTRWVATLHVAQITPGGSLSVVLQVSATGEEDDWTDLVAFPTAVAIGSTVLDSTLDPPGFVVTPRRDVYIRAVIRAITGEVVAELRVAAPFLSSQVSADMDLISKELRQWSDGLNRVLIEAEADVLEVCLADKDTGRLDIDLSAVGVHKIIQLEIADQADHLKRKDVLGRSHEPSAITTVRQMSRLFPGFGIRLRKYRPRSSSVWYGR